MGLLGSTPGPLWVHAASDVSLPVVAGAGEPPLSGLRCRGSGGTGPCGLSGRSDGVEPGMQVLPAVPARGFGDRGAGAPFQEPVSR